MSFTSCVEETLLNRVLSEDAELNTEGGAKVGVSSSVTKELAVESIEPDGVEELGVISEPI